MFTWKYGRFWKLGAGLVTLGFWPACLLSLVWLTLLVFSGPNLTLDTLGTCILILIGIAYLGGIIAKLSTHKVPCIAQ